MALDRTSSRVAPKIERRPAISKTVQRSVAARPKSPSLQEQLGNRATQILVARSVANSAKEGAGTRLPISPAPYPSIQFSRTTRLPVSKPGDPAELEAEETAKKVMRMREPAQPAQTAQKGPARGTVQRVEAQFASPPAPSAARVNIPGGAPLPTGVRNT